MIQNLVNQSVSFQKWSMDYVTNSNKLVVVVQKASNIKICLKIICCEMSNLNDLIFQSVLIFKNLITFNHLLIWLSNQSLISLKYVILCQLRTLRYLIISHRILFPYFNPVTIRKQLRVLNIILHPINQVQKISLSPSWCNFEWRMVPLSKRLPVSLNKNLWLLSNLLFLHRNLDPFEIFEPSYIVWVKGLKVLSIIITVSLKFGNIIFIAWLYFSHFDLTHHKSVIQTHFWKFRLN